MERNLTNMTEERSEQLSQASQESRTSSTPMPENESRPRSRRGFASMDPERRRQVASTGGRTAHQQGVAHKWTREEASAAGRKGQALRRAASQIGPSI